MCVYIYMIYLHISTINPPVHLLNIHQLRQLQGTTSEVESPSQADPYFGSNPLSFLQRARAKSKAVKGRRRDFLRGLCLVVQPKMGNSFELTWFSNKRWEGYCGSKPNGDESFGKQTYGKPPTCFWNII